MHTVLRVKRVREKYESELRELERSERAAVEKQQELRKQQMETEGELIRLQASLRQKEQEVEEITQVRCTSLTFGMWQRSKRKNHKILYIYNVL